MTRTQHRVPMALGLAAAVVTATLVGAAATPKFYADDPVWVEHDTEDASDMARLDVNLFVDLTYNMIANRDVRPGGRARNLNTVDEVPDSSWFTNRAGRRRLTAEDVARGPDTGAGPADGPWIVSSSKTDGVTPGFTIKDSDNQRWFLKFDPPGYRGMATGTEVTVTKLMWALGYHVPENHIAQLRRDRLVIGKGAKVTLAQGRERPMRASDIDRLLERAERAEDGSYRVVASKALEGTPVGRIRFERTRPDDPNDLVPHEDRRELRGYGVFAAWLNHVDAKAINSLDMLVEGADGRRVVRHNLIDFGSSLGSGGVGPADAFSGSEYLLEPRGIGRQMIGFGFTPAKWHTTSFYEARTIGRLPKNNGAFDPNQWKPRVPNAAFLRARGDDKFWAAQKLAAVTTDMLRAAVRAGEFHDPNSEAFLVSALAERRDGILRAYLTELNPIADPMLVDGALTFRNAAVDADVARAPREYRAAWFAFDNTDRTTTALGESAGPATRLDAPAMLPRQPGALVKVALSSAGAPRQSWETPVDAYFQHTADGWRLVGFERMPEQ